MRIWGSAAPKHKLAAFQPTPAQFEELHKPTKKPFKPNATHRTLHTKVANPIIGPISVNSEATMRNGFSPPSQTRFNLENGPISNRRKLEPLDGDSNQTTTYDVPGTFFASYSICAWHTPVLMMAFVLIGEPDRMATRCHWQRKLDWLICDSDGFRERDSNFRLFIWLCFAKRGFRFFFE